MSTKPGQAQTPFDTSAELRKGNVAVGIVVGSIFIGVGVAIGLVIEWVELAGCEGTGA